VLRLAITPRAASDVKEAVRYYTNEASPAVARRFRDEFRDACTVLASNPGIGSRRFAHVFEFGAVRTWSLDRFPFRLFYAVDGDTLKVLAVDHERRNVTSASISPPSTH